MRQPCQFSEPAVDLVPCAICWSMSRNYFVRFGTDHYDRAGDLIPVEALYWHDQPQYRTVQEFQADDLGGAQAVIDAAFPAVGYTLIHLADDEWGNEAMRQIAEEHFAAHADCQFVEVYEHAGWYLGFRRDGSIWGTANDMAVLSKPRPRPALGCMGTIRR